jgi:activator of HSP90 ATPase
MKTKNIKQVVNIKAGLHEVYEALMDSRKHSQFTGDTAKISRKVDGKFNVWGDYITGVNLGLVQDKKIVQSWHASDWTEGHFSRVTFALAKAKNGGTKLTFTQTGVPAEFYKDIKDGWVEYYWEPLKKMLEK